MPAHAMVSPGDPPSVFVRFTDADQVRGALHGDPPQPRCLIQGVSGLFPGTRIEAAFQLPSSIVVQVDARVLAIDGDQAMLQLSSDNPADIASLLQARG